MEKQELFNCSTNRAFSKIQKFWELNGSRFPLYYQKYFKANIFEIIDNNDLENVDDVTKSILNYLGLLSFSADKESQFLSFFEQYFNANDFYNKKIVAVTQEFVPTLEKKVSDEMFKGHYNGSIRTYGSNIVVPDPKLHPINKQFTKFDLDVKDDMVVCFSPRENSERIFFSAVDSRKELLLNFDGYVPERDGFFMPTKDGFLGELYDYAMRNKSDDFEADIVNYSPQGDTALVLKRK